MIIQLNESKALLRHISCKRKCRFDGKNVSHGIMINVDMSVINVMYVRKILFGILLHVIAKMENI